MGYIVYPLWLVHSPTSLVINVCIVHLSLVARRQKQAQVHTLQ